MPRAFFHYVLYFTFADFQVYRFPDFQMCGNLEIGFKLGPSQISGNLEIWEHENLEFWNAQNHAKKSKSKSVLPKMSARFGFAGKNTSWPHLGPFEAKCSMDRNNACLFSSVGQWALFTGFEVICWCNFDIVESAHRHGDAKQARIMCVLSVPLQDQVQGVPKSVPGPRPGAGPGPGPSPRPGPDIFKKSQNLI